MADPAPKRRRRFDRLAWRTLPDDDEVRAEYMRIEERLQTTARTRKEARAGTNYLYQFVVRGRRHAARGAARFREARDDPPDGRPDPRILSGTQQDLQYAHAAWNAMCREALWGPTYIREVRTCLSRALLLFGEPLPGGGCGRNRCLGPGARREAGVGPHGRSAAFTPGCTRGPARRRSSA